MTLLTRHEAARVVTGQCQARRPGWRRPHPVADPEPAAYTAPPNSAGALLVAAPREDFSGEPLSVSVVAEVIAGSAATGASLVCAASAQQEVITLVAALRVQGLAAGLYLIGADGPQAWRPVSCPVPLAELRQRYCAAPALIMLAGDVCAASQAGAGTGYPELLVMAGVRGYALLQSAASHQLAGCAFCSPARQVTVAARGVVDQARHLFTVAIGYPKVAP
jgi:hypothetical protein